MGQSKSVQNGRGENEAHGVEILVGAGNQQFGRVSGGFSITQIFPSPPAPQKGRGGNGEVPTTHASRPWKGTIFA